MKALYLGVEAFESWKVFVIGLISSGLALASYGEANFDLVEFILVMSAMLLGALRMILSQMLFHPPAEEEGAQPAHEPLTSMQILYLQTPISFLVLLPSWIRLFRTAHETRLATDPTFFWHTVGWVLLGAGLAFFVDLFNLLMIAVSSALSSSVAGCAKTAILVLMSWLFFRNEITFLNIVGYSICVSGVIGYNIVKYRRLVEIERTSQVRDGLDLSPKFGSTLSYDHLESDLDE